MRLRRLRLRRPGRLPRALALLVCLIFAVVPAAGFRMCIDGSHVAFGAIDGGCPCEGHDDHDPDEPCSDVCVELPDAAHATPLGALVALDGADLLAGVALPNLMAHAPWTVTPPAQPPPDDNVRVPWVDATAQRRTIVLQV